jgi:pyruvate/2-oxoglutarate dehydrogenase complex dihydrolipoamide acyltransferase (E2) component
VTTPIMIPKLGVAMTEGTIVSWAVPDGGTVVAGDVLYAIETDKVENDIPAPVSGVVRHLAVAGETYPVGTKIAEIEQAQA